jgi:iron complex outermembrane receptor protein
VITPLLWLGSFALAAETVDPFEEQELSELFAMEEELVTVASRYAQTTREAPAIVTVITAEEIRRLGYRTLAEVLRGLPGVTVSRSKEGLTLAWFRGSLSSDNNKFLLLVDGVPWYDGVYQHAWIDAYLPLEIVKQIEVIKGPGSTIYGTNAYAGVVQVVTWRASDLEGGFAELEIGSATTIGATAVAGGRLGAGTDKLMVLAYGKAFSTLGDGLEITPKGQSNVQGTNPIRTAAAGARGSWRGLEFSYDHVDFRRAYLTQPQDDLLDVLFQASDQFYLDYRGEYLSARWAFTPSRNLTITPRSFFQEHDNPGLYGWMSDPETTIEDDGTTTTELKTTLVETEKHTIRYGLGVDLEARPAAGHLTISGVGFEGMRILELEDRVYEDSDGQFTNDEFYAVPGTGMHGVFGYLQHTWTAMYWLELTGGLRLDYNLFGPWPFVSPRLGVLLVPTSNIWVKLLYGRAFRAPNAREYLIQTGFDEDGLPTFTASNDGLVPEIINTVEGEVTWVKLGAQVRGAAFASRLSKTIGVSDEYVYENQGGATVFGTELEFTWSSDLVDAGVSWAWIRGIDLDTGRPLYGIPAHALHTTLTVQPLTGLYLSVVADAFSPRPREVWAPDSGLQDGPAYVLFDLAVTTDRIGNDRVRLSGSVHNVLNTDYADMILVDDANAVSGDSAKYPEDIQGEGRLFLVEIEAEF